MKRINNIEELKKNIEEVETDLMRTFTITEFMNMNSDGIAATQRAFKLLDALGTLVVEQAETINEINEKLNLLLELKKDQV